MTSSIRRIAISTGGGDAPGLNAVIRAATLSALVRGWDVVGIREGFHGLLDPERFPHGGVVPLTRDAVSGIAYMEERSSARRTAATRFTIQRSSPMAPRPRSTAATSSSPRFARRASASDQEAAWS